MKEGAQFELDFGEKRNRFKDDLENGRFLLLFEVETPLRDCDLPTAVARLEPITSVVEKLKSVRAGIAVTDKLSHLDSYNVAEFAARLLPSDRDRHLLFITGREGNEDETRRAIAACAGYGFPNIVAVTGDGVPSTNGRPVRSHHVDSTRILSFCKALKTDGRPTEPIYQGCVANPFKYVPLDVFPQYLKLVKKFNFGANFVVTQAGWDMMKLQEMRWYLEMRGLYHQSLARVMILTPEVVAEILADKRPGVRISPDFRSMLEKESKFSEVQFMAAQWRRIQLMAAGLRFLGYNGVIISGAERPQWVQTAASKITEALEEFQSFNEWRDAYASHLSRAEMAPYPHRFYIFDNLLKIPHDDAPAMRKVSSLEWKSGERMRLSLARRLFKKSRAECPSRFHLMKKLLTGCPGCRSCRLDITHFVCPETCPKGLGNGPCGGSRANGDCELGGKPCIHGKIFKTAAASKTIDSLEDTDVPAAPNA